MRGTDRKQSQLFSYVSLEERVPRKHPLRLMRKFTDRVLAGLSPQFEAIYAKQGRPSARTVNWTIIRLAGRLLAYISILNPSPSRQSKARSSR